MAIKTYNDLVAEIDLIKNEVADGANTATRVANTLQDILDSAMYKKVWAGVFNQNGNNNPVVVEWLNQLSGPIVWTRSAQGQYLGNLAGAFPENKVPKVEGLIRYGTNIASGTLMTWRFMRISDDYVLLGTERNAVLTDDLLNDLYFEFYVLR